MLDNFAEAKVTQAGRDGQTFGNDMAACLMNRALKIGPFEKQKMDLQLC